MSLRDPNVTNPRSRRRVALVIANPAVSTTTGWPVGFWWSELTHPYHVFTEVGYDVQLFSPDGGACVADAMSDPNDPSGYSRSDLISQGFIHTPELRALVDATKGVADLDVHAFDAIVVAGGQAPMFTFERAAALQRVFEHCRIPTTPAECAELLDSFTLDRMAAGDGSIVIGGAFEEAARSRSEPEGFFGTGRGGGWQDEWRNEDRLAFDAVAGDLLIECGYAPDHDWAGTATARARFARRIARRRRRAATLQRIEIGRAHV